MKNTNIEINNEVRAFGRQVAKELDMTQLEKINGGTTSCSCHNKVGDDCDSVLR